MLMQIIISSFRTLQKDNVNEAFTEIQLMNINAQKCALSTAYLSIICTSDGSSAVGLGCIL